LIILSPSDSDAATLAASSQVATLPVTNLQSMPPKRKWRASGAAAEYIELDFGTGVAANGLALIGHNLTGSATIRVRGKATYPVTISPAVDTGSVSAWPASGKPTVARWPQYFSWVAWTSIGTLRYWRIDIADGTNSAGYIEAGRLMLGSCWQ